MLTLFWLVNFTESGGKWTTSLSLDTHVYCFKCLKSNGFNLQLLNFKKPEKISLLMAVVVFAYVLCVVEGFKAKGKIAIKKYKSGKTALLFLTFAKACKK
jgi:hypothetical protein